jgi:glycosyltransferase involved in cell wall biosynthesis
MIHVPSVSTLHTLELPKKRKYAFWRLNLKWFVLRHLCDAILTVSKKTRDHHLQYGRLPQQKVKIIYNGIQLSRFQNRDQNSLAQIKLELGLKSNHIVITTVAVLREPKGIQYMFKALPEILSQIPNLTYLVVGDGKYAASLRDIVAELRLNEHVIFAGHRTDIPDILALSNLFVLPSLDDALPTALIEALAAETPIVATRVGGIPEIIEDGINGLLVSSANPNQLTDACLKILKDKDLSHLFTSNGLEIAERRFDVKVQVEQLQNLYTELIKQYE